MATAVSSIQSGASQDQPTGVRTVTDPLAEKQTFLKLLVAELKNQDPLNPSDPMTFMSQLTSFSQLEQLLGLRESVEELVAVSEDVKAIREHLEKEP